MVPVSEQRSSTTNTVLSAIGGALLILGLIVVLALGFIYLMMSSICGDSCDAAHVVLLRAWLVLGVGGLLAAATGIPAMVWRRWSSLFLWLGVVIVVVTVVVSWAVIGTPLNDVRT
ncbi:hypothetical protein [Gordonia sp. (in: high G+C Gram-positive bacteria)]|uniref:hypothetical protein n=1 Tax=Gordonia sp. (in: high G+C Gram-positive bacteria) TaxID=84139 RepID=UPI0039E5E455